jgi:hypothetical protein
VSGGSGFVGSWPIASTNSGNNSFTFSSASCSGNGSGGTASVTTGTTGFSGNTGITCTLGTNQSCSDTTHGATVNVGDAVVILGQNNSGTSDTLSDIRVALEKQ